MWGAVQAEEPESSLLSKRTSMIRQARHNKSVKEGCALHQVAFKRGAERSQADLQLLVADFFSCVPGLHGLEKNTKIEMARACTVQVCQTLDVCC